MGCVDALLVGKILVRIKAVVVVFHELINKNRVVVTENVKTG
jgi:hypothetical protein